MATPFTALMDARLPATGADPVEQARGDQRLRAGLSSSVAVICASLAMTSAAFGEETAPIDAAAAAPAVESAPTPPADPPPATLAPAPAPAAPVAQPSPPPAVQQTAAPAPVRQSVANQVAPKNNNSNNGNANGQNGGNQGGQNGGNDNPNNGQGNGGKVTICHQTGSATNPYVVITTANQAVINAHLAHGDEVYGDGASCGGETPGGGGETPGGGSEAPGGSTETPGQGVTETPGTTNEPAGEQEVLGDREENEPREQDEPRDEQELAGDREEAGERGFAPRAVPANAADSPAVEVSPAAASEELPFTGFAALYAALVGVFMLMTGIALRGYDRVRTGRR